MLYLDHAATTPLRPEAAAAMAPWLGEQFGNTSGSHAVSRRAKNALEVAREQVAAVLGAKPTEIVFTGGGTEADNLALMGRAAVSGGVVTTAVEHEAVLATSTFLGRLGRPSHGRWSGSARHGRSRRGACRGGPGHSDRVGHVGQQRDGRPSTDC